MHPDKSISLRIEQAERDRRSLEQAAEDRRKAGEFFQRHRLLAKMAGPVSRPLLAELQADYDPKPEPEAESLFDLTDLEALQAFMVTGQTPYTIAGIDNLPPAFHEPSQEETPAQPLAVPVHELERVA